MNILRAANHRVMPWKNGLGSTTEIAISPVHAEVDDFDWRVSMAHVTADGPFSCFPGIDRTLLVLEGSGIILTVADRGPVRLDRGAMHAFPGDQPTSAVLTDGPILDLNVMTRRGHVQHRVQRIKIMSPQHFQASNLTLLVVENGMLDVRADARHETLAAKDTLVLDRHIPIVTVASASQTDVIAIELW